MGLQRAEHDRAHTHTHSLYVNKENHGSKSGIMDYAYSFGIKITHILILNRKLYLDDNTIIRKYWVFS